MKYSKLRFTCSFLIIGSILLSVLPLRAQDLIPTSDITNGTSIFIFRQASNKQTRLANKNFAQRPQVFRLEARKKIALKRQLPAENRAGKRNPKIINNAAIKNSVARQNGKIVPVKKPTAPVSKLKASENFADAGEKFLDEKDAVQAIGNFKKALELNPKNERAMRGLSDADTRRADALDVDGEFSAAIPLYREAVQMDAANAEAFGGLGEALDETNDKDGALENYLKALTLDSTLDDYDAPAAIIYYQKGNYGEAEKYLDKILAKNPQDAEAKYFQGLVKFKQNQNADAAKIFEENAAADPSNAENFYYLGAVYDRLERTDDAVNQYLQAIKINPNYAEAWFDLGVIYYNQSKYTDAAAAYGEAVKIKPDFAAAHANLASSLRQLKNYEQANAEYADAAKEIKDDPDLYSEWGYCLGKVDQWDKAAERVNSAAALAPEAFAYSNLGWVYFNAAQLDLKQNQIDAANAKLQKGKEVLEKATEINVNFEPAYLNLGVTLNGLKDYPNAIAALTKANDLRKNWLPAINQLGIVYRGSGDLNAAVEQFQKAVGLDSTFAEGFYNLGEAQFRLGNKKEARKAQETLKKLNPELSKKLDDVIEGRIIDAGVNRVQQEIQKKNPIKKLPKLPF